MDLPELIIEVTRKCNMQCSHCLRGRAQNVNIDHKYIDTLLDGVESIGSITFTGGEPSLNAEAISYTLDLCKRLNISVGYLFISTNGLNVPEKFVVECLKWYNYCDDKDMCSVVVSNDIYHEDYDNALILEGLSFFSFRNYSDSFDYSNGKSLINEGLASDFGIGERDLNVPDSPKSQEELLEGLLYLNVFGEILNDCDLSYESQSGYVMCHVNEFDLFVGLLPEYLD